jgi:hypothetical protein
MGTPMMWAHLYKRTNPQLRFRYSPADEHGEPLDGGEPTEV